MSSNATYGPADREPGRVRGYCDRGGFSPREFSLGNDELVGEAPVRAILKKRLRVIVPGRVLLVSILLSLAVVNGTATAPTVLRLTAAERQLGRANTWSATSSTGQRLMGTWTAVPDPASGSVTGTWTLADATGQTLARGGWSAVKSPSGKKGTWRANVSGRTAEYAGTWSTDVDLGAGARLSNLLEKAVESVVSGRWRAGGQSGAWSIRAFN